MRQSPLFRKLKAGYFLKICPDMTEKLLTGTVKPQHKQTSLKDLSAREKNLLLVELVILVKYAITMVCVKKILG